MGDWKPLDLDEEMRKFVKEVDPSFEVLASVCASAVEPLSRMAIKHAPSHAASGVVTQCTNDWLDLLRDLNAGRGRPALRCARGIIEHLANIRDLQVDAAAVERFEDHDQVVRPHTVEQAQELLGLNEMGDEFRRPAIKFFSRNTRRHTREREELLQRYNRQFANRWHAKNLRQRLEDQEDARRYDFYRFASALLHGGPTGEHGLVFQLEDDRPQVHRTGAAVSLCPIAYRHGNRAFSAFCQELTWVKMDLRESALEAIIDFQDHWPIYFEAMQQLDGSLLPQQQPMLIPVVVVGRNRTPQWWLHDVENGLVVKAEAHDPEIDLKLSELTDSLSVRSPEFAEGRQVTVALTAGDVQPIAGEPWRNESVLPPKEGRF